ncbi:MAG: efflux RND transporter periplasmic adaptor subunit [Burkholderiales bacterium]
MRILPLTLISVAAITLAAGVYFYWEHSARYPSTDDAYLDANTVRVAPLVGGRVARVYVRDQQHVRRNDRLFDIDPAPFSLTLREAEARLALAQQGAASALGELRAAEAEVKNREILLGNAKTIASRNARLVAQGFLSHQSGDDAAAAVKSAAAELALAQAKAYQARMALGNKGEQNEHVREALAALGKAQLDLQHTQVSAACDGVITEFALHPGDTLQENAPVFALICEQEYWVDANFKETQLDRIRPGQPAEIRVDMYPNKIFAGKVENIGGATGAAFSLLPPQNATGNWVKVTQRVPVRIAVTQRDPRFPLRVGTSASVTVDTTSLRHP